MIQNTLASGVEKVLIIGGGIAGMAAAIRFRERGVEVDLIERDPNWKVYGAGLTLSVLTMRALCDLGFAEQIMAKGSAHDGLEMYDSQANLVREIKSPRLYSKDVPAEGGIMRPILHEMMSKRVNELGAQVRLGVSVDKLETINNKVSVSFSDGTPSTYDVALGADGLTSKTRTMLFPHSAPPQFTGQACWRVQYDRPKGWDTNRMYIGPNVKLGFTLCAPNKMYMYLLEHVPDNPRVAPQDYVPKLRELMDGFAEPVASLRDQLSDELSINYRPLEWVLLEESWTRGHVALLGDAAHATTPHLGSGAGAAVEDAIVLVDELARCGSMGEAFAAYETRRIPRASIVVKNSLKLGELEMAHAPMSELGGLLAASFEEIAKPYR